MATAWIKKKKSKQFEKTHTYDWKKEKKDPNRFFELPKLFLLLFTKTFFEFLLYFDQIDQINY